MERATGDSKRLMDRAILHEQTHGEEHEEHEEHEERSPTPTKRPRQQYASSDSTDESVHNIASDESDYDPSSPARRQPKRQRTGRAPAGGGRKGRKGRARTLADVVGRDPAAIFEEQGIRTVEAVAQLDAEMAGILASTAGVDKEQVVGAILKAQKVSPKVPSVDLSDETTAPESPALQGGLALCHT